MATTRAAAQLSTSHRAAQLAVRARSVRGLISLWKMVDPENLSGTVDTFIEAATLLAVQGQQESASEAVRYFRSFRRAEGLTNDVRLMPAPRPALRAIAADLRGAALKGILDARRAGRTLLAAGQDGLVRVTGAMVKQVLAGGRMTIINGVDSDRRAVGWVRATTGDPCTFCRLLASRGAVYKSERSAEFEAHDACACTPEPLYDGPQLDGGPLAQSAAYLAEYTTAQAWARESGTMSKGTSNDSLNNYRRWLANGSPALGQQPTGAPGA